jgi:hypothetical protein
MHDDDGNENEEKRGKKKERERSVREWREMVARRELRFMNSRSDVTLTRVALTPLTAMFPLSIDYNLLARIHAKL